MNATRNVILASKVFVANNFFMRFKGLLGTRKLDAGCGLVLIPCNQIHMFWMTYAIDALFISKEGVVVGLAERLKPWRVSPAFKGSNSCLELPAGTISSTGTQIGDKIEMKSHSN
jgi:uncharacterized membrane protein (UPF0127 family)